MKTSIKTCEKFAEVVMNESFGAQKGLPAFNYSDIWDLMAIISAAEKLNTDIFIMSNPLVAEMFGVQTCQAMVASRAKKVKVKIVHHLDHSPSIDLCIAAIDAGYPSVMFDGSQKTLDENIRMTREVVSYAHEKGVIVEGEIGKIKGSGVEGDYEGGAFLADVDEAIELVQATNVDSLAVGIGTAHGFYTEAPAIEFDLLKKIFQAVKIPLVLHGGTGIPDADIQRAISDGICKVNVGTLIHSTYLSHLKNVLNDENGSNPYTLDVMAKVMIPVEKIVMDRIRVIKGF